MSDFKLTPAREKELEKIAKDLPDADFKKKYGKDWKSVKIATAMNILKKKKGFNTEEKMKFKDLREKYRSKYKPEEVAKAVEIALSMGGNMTGAYNKIEKIKKGLGDDPVVKDALRTANESVNEDDSVNEAKTLTRQEILSKYGNEIKKALRTGNLELSDKGEEDLSRYVLDNYPEEIPHDDPDLWVDWLDNNLEDFYKGKGYK